MQAKFESKFDEWYAVKKTKYILETVDDYQARLAAVQKLGITQKLTKQECNWAATFQIEEIGDEQRLLHGTKKMLVRDQV